MNRRTFVKNSLITGVGLAVSATTVKAERLFGRQINNLPVRITRSGTYSLSRDLKIALASGVAIDILVDDVTLDLNGHTINNQSTETLALGIRVIGKENIVVENGNLRGFYMGVVSINERCRDLPSRIVLRDLSLTKTRFASIVGSANGLLIERCKVSDVGDASLDYGSFGILTFGMGGLVRECSVMVGVREHPAIHPRIGIASLESTTQIVKNCNVINCEIGIQVGFGDDLAASSGVLDNTVVGAQFSVLAM